MLPGDWNALLMIAASFLVQGPAPPVPARGPDKQGPILTGRIVDEAGRPLPGVKVVLYNGLYTRWKGQETTTGPDGRYRFDPLRSGGMVGDGANGRWDWRTGLRLEHPTHVNADGKSWRDIQVPGIDRREHVQDFRMVPGGRLRGRVLDPKIGKPLRRLDLIIASPDLRRHRFKVDARTDDDGRFVSETLFPGEYVVVANVPELNYRELGRFRIEATQTLKRDFAQDRRAWAIARGISALYGKNRLQELTAFTMTTRETHDDGRTSTTKHEMLLPDRYRRETRDEGDPETLITIVTADGVRQWSRRDGGPPREVELRGLGLVLAHSRAYRRDYLGFFGPRAVLRLEDPDYRITLLDDAEFEGKPVFRVALEKRVPGLWMQMRMSFDLDTGLLLRQEEVREEIETVLADYKEFNVVPVARQSVVKRAGGKVLVRSEIVEYKAEETIAARLFREP